MIDRHEVALWAKPGSFGNKFAMYRNSNSRTQKGDKEMRFARKRGFFVGVLSTIVLLTMVSSAFCAFLTVGEGEGYDYATIQEAVDAAQSGDVILVAEAVWDLPEPYYYQIEDNEKDVWIFRWLYAPLY